MSRALKLTFAALAVIAAGLTFFVFDSFSGLSVFATVYENFEYSDDGDSITITKYNGSSSSVEVPSEIDGKPVTVIGYGAFQGKNNMTNIKLPEGIISIGDFAFDGCQRLSAITFPQTLETIGGRAFSACTSLKSISIPASVKSIGGAAFQNCALTSVEFSEGIEVIGGWSFTWCPGFEKIVIPDSIVSIEGNAFGSTVGEIIVPDRIDISDIGIQDSTTRIKYETDANGNITITGVQLGNDKSSVDIPDDIFGKNVTTVIIEKGTNANIPAAANVIEYEIDEDGNVTITDVRVGDGQGSVKFPEKIAGQAADVSEKVREELKGIEHNHIGGTTACIKGKICIICDEEYSEPSGHSFTSYVSDDNATCTNDGTETARCDNCDEKDTRTIAGSVIGHNYIDGKCTVCGEADSDTPETEPAESSSPEDGSTPSGGNGPSGTPSGGGTAAAVSSTQLLLAEIANAKDGDTIIFDLKGSTIAERSVFNAIAGRDITLIIKLNNKVYWSVNGKDIEKSKKVDLGVTLNSKFASADELNELAGDRKTVKFSLAHSGDLGFTGLLNIPVSNTYNGQYANLYYYGKNGFEFVVSSKISDGCAEFVFSHASDYVIVIDQYAYGDDVSSAAGMYLVGQIVEDAVPVVGFVIPIAVSLVMILRKKKA